MENASPLSLWVGVSIFFPFEDERLRRVCKEKNRWRNFQRVYKYEIPEIYHTLLLDVKSPHALARGPYI